MSNVEKIAALLAMAERTDNEAEADAFLRKAQMLATTYSIDLAMAQSKIAKREQREQPINRRFTIGEPGKQINKHLINLFSVIAGANDVQLDIAHANTYVIEYGMPSDADICEALWASISHQMVTAANAYIKSGEWKGETYIVYGRDYRGYLTRTVKDHTARTAKTAFYQAYIQRMFDRLQRARNEALAEAREREAHFTATAPASDEAGEGRAPVGMDLVLKTKKDEIDAHYKKTSTARGSWKGYRGSVSTSGNVAKAGHAAAEATRITAAKGVAGTSGAIAG